MFEKKTIRVKLLNNDGAGFAGYVDVPEGTSIGEFLALKAPGQTEDNFKVRVNKEAVTRDQVLQHGDSVSIAPKNVKGASSFDRLI